MVDSTAENEKTASTGRHNEPEDQDKKFKVFTDWCDKNGIKYPNQQYPAFFDQGLLGVRAKAPIKHREAFL